MSNTFREKNIFKLATQKMWWNPVFSHNITVKSYKKAQLLKRFIAQSKNNMDSAQWMAEKHKMLNIPLEEKRKVYKSKTFVTIDELPTWKTYLTEQLTDVDKKQPNADDIHEYKKIKIDKNLNSGLINLISIFKGDITQLEVDAVVNAANSRLRAGGGVDGAIHRAAGSYLQTECNTLGGCKIGEAKITCGYNLPAKYVIHTVGPQDGSEKALRDCYNNSLQYCTEHTIQSIAFPCISTGIYGFPNRLAAHIALQSVRAYLEKHRNSMQRVIFCLFMPVDIEIYETLLPMYFPDKDVEYP